MSLERFVAARFRVHELRSKRFNLVHYFLPRGIQGASECRIDRIQSRTKRFQFSRNVVSRMVECLHPLDTCNGFSSYHIATAKHVRELEAVLAHGSRDARLENGRADPRHNRRQQTLQRFIHSSSLREISDLRRTADICGRWKQRILHRRPDQHIRAQREISAQFFGTKRLPRFVAIREASSEVLIDFYLLVVAGFRQRTASRKDGASNLGILTDHLMQSRSGELSKFVIQRIDEYHPRAV